MLPKSSQTLLIPANAFTSPKPLPSDTFFQHGSGNEQPELCFPLNEKQSPPLGPEFRIQLAFGARASAPRILAPKNWSWQLRRMEQVPHGQGRVGGRAGDPLSSNPPIPGDLRGGRERVALAEEERSSSWEISELGQGCINLVQR